MRLLKWSVYIILVVAACSTVSIADQNTGESQDFKDKYLTCIIPPGWLHPVLISDFWNNPGGETRTYLIQNEDLVCTLQPYSPGESGTDEEKKSLVLSLLEDGGLVSENLDMHDQNPDLYSGDAVTVAEIDSNKIPVDVRARFTGQSVILVCNSRHPWSDPAYEDTYDETVWDFIMSIVPAGEDEPMSTDSPVSPGSATPSSL